jgi:4-hydroxy-tetrahydrodipicolinate synthase
MVDEIKRGRIGLNCALSTPFAADGSIDLPRMAAHATHVIESGCDGITVFGTTGEGASIANDERRQVLEALSAAGLDIPARVIAGVSAATVTDTVEQARIGYAAGCRALLLAPPFYFGAASDEGLFDFFAAVFGKLGSDLRDVILYHIPGMTRNGISIELTQRLAAAFPGAIIGIKDSNGDWTATERRLRELQGMQVLVGDERQLARAVRQGGAGTICGLANIAPDLLAPLAHAGADDQRVSAMVEAIIAHSFMSAVKAVLAENKADPEWLRMRPPLDPLSEADARALAGRLAAIRAGGAARAA